MIRALNQPFIFTSLVCLASVLASSCAEGTLAEDMRADASRPGADAHVRDTGSSTDASPPRDAVVQPDGSAPDAGSNVDAGSTQPDANPPSDAGGPCPPPTCNPGDGRCTINGDVQVCVTDQWGCVDWNSPSPCGGAAECAGGRCVNCVDNDGDGYGENCASGGDCDDTDPTIYEQARELCDGVDNDCDGDIDEVFSQVGSACTYQEQSCTAPGVWACAANGLGIVCEGSITPSTEICDGVDNDCDGDVDENFGLLGAACTSTQNGCSASGQYICDANGTGVVCNASVNGSTEVCDGVDNDCDGRTDEDYTNLGDTCQAGSGACAVSGRVICDPNDVWSTTCDAPTPPGSGGAEICDGVDNDCDGQTDEGVCATCVEDAYEENDLSLDGTPLTSNGTLADAVLCGSLGADLDRDWYRLGAGAAGATVELTYPTGTNGAGAPYPQLRIDLFCDTAYCGNFAGSNGNLQGTIPTCGTAGCNYAFYVYNSGANPASGTPYDVTRR